MTSLKFLFVASIFILLAADFLQQTCVSASYLREIDSDAFRSINYQSVESDAEIPDDGLLEDKASLKSPDPNPNPEPGPDPANIYNMPVSEAQAEFNSHLPYSLYYLLQQQQQKHEQNDKNKARPRPSSSPVLLDQWAIEADDEMLEDDDAELLDMIE